MTGLHYYYFPTSYWSRIVSLVIAAKGLAATRHIVDIRHAENFEPDYLRLNPRGVVPTIVDDGRAVWDGPTIVRHLEAAGGPAVVGEPDALLVELEQLPLMLMSYSVWIKGSRGEKSADILADKVERAATYATRYPELAAHYERKREFFAKFRAQVYDEGHVQAQAEHVGQVLERATARLEERPWLGPGRMGYPDFILVSALYRLADLRRVDGWADDPGHPLRRWFERARAQPEYQAVFVDDPHILPQYRRDGSLPRP
ncbi:MAG: glutathione S-transferase family protein [Deltaproteobacteria bacterium]|nr:glutathione S-transferase family protein [Deltaproteobacteria bacterium]